MRGTFGDELARTIKDYRDLASLPYDRTNGRHFLYVPSGADNFFYLAAAIMPDALSMNTSEGHGNEPAYKTIGEALEGRNHDGSPHKGFVILDVKNPDEPVTVGQGSREEFERLLEARERYPIRRIY